MTGSNDLNLMLMPKLEAYTKLVLGFIASCYAVGILVVNIFYGKFGFYSLSLFRINYVIAGFWAILVLVFVYLFFRILLDSFRHIFGKNKREKELIRFIALLIFSAALLIFVSTTIARYFEIEMGWKWLLIPLAGCMGLTYISKLIKKAPLNLTIFASDTTAIFNVLFGLSLLVGYIVSFSTSLFPNIPANIGGGHPQKVQLVISKSFEPYLAVQGVKFIDLQSDSTKVDYHKVIITDTLDLLLLTDREIVLTVRNFKNQSFSINRNDNILIHFVRDEALKN